MGKTDGAWMGAGMSGPYMVTQQIDGDETVLHHTDAFADALEDARREGGEVSICAPPRGIVAIVRGDTVRFTREATDYEKYPLAETSQENTND